MAVAQCLSETLRRFERGEREISIGPSGTDRPLDGTAGPPASFNQTNAAPD